MPRTIHIAERFDQSLVIAASRDYGRAQSTRTWLLTASICLAVTATIAAALTRAGEFLVVDNAARSDVMVVLGGDDGTRRLKAVELFKEGYANEIIVDADAQKSWLGRTEAERTAAWIASLGDAGNHIHVCPITATSTAGESANLHDCIDRRQLRRILLVTSDYHTRRALATFRRSLPQYEWNVASAENSDSFGTAWWRNRAWTFTAIHEWEKLLWWKAVDQWTA